MKVNEAAKALKLTAYGCMCSYKTAWDVYLDPRIKNKFTFEEVVKAIEEGRKFSMDKFITGFYWAWLILAAIGAGLELALGDYWQSFSYLCMVVLNATILMYRYGKVGVLQDDSKQNL